MAVVESEINLEASHQTLYLGPPLQAWAAAGALLVVVVEEEPFLEALAHLNEILYQD